MAYVKNYHPGQIHMDLPTANYIYELPLLSFGDIHGSVNLSLIFNRQMKAEVTNPYNIAAGFKLNLQKKLTIVSGKPVRLQEANGNCVDVIGSSAPFTLFDDSQRIIRLSGTTYTLENADMSKEVYDQNGRITHVYNKYNDLVLQYTYDAAGKLTAIVYRGSKAIRLQYDSASRLTTVVYTGDNCRTSLVHISNGIRVFHYSGVTYNISMTGGALFGAQATAIENEDTVTHATTLSNSAANTMEIVDRINGEIVNSTAYVFPENIQGFNGKFSQVEVTDHLGVKTRMQYSGRRLLYSYEVTGDDVSFLNEKFAESIQIHHSPYSPRNCQMKGVLNIDDGIPMQRDDYNPEEQRWEFNAHDNPARRGAEFYYLTGWIRRADAYEYGCNGLYISDGGQVQAEFFPQVASGTQWTFFAIGFSMSASFIEVRPEFPQMVELKDLRMVFEKNGVLVDNYSEHSVASDDVLIHYTEDGKAVYIPIRSATIACGDVPIEGTDVAVTFGDLLKYKINQRRGVNTTEFYYNSMKEVYTSPTVPNATVTYGEETYDLSDCYLGQQKYAPNNTITTRIRDDDANAFLVYETLGANNSVLSSQVLDEHLDVVSTTADGVTTTYVRNNDLVTSESVASASGKNLYTRTTAYGEDSAGNPTITETDEFGSRTVYTLDPDSGTVVSVMLPDEDDNNSRIVDEYDDGRSARIKRYFGQSDMRTNLHSYAGGNLSRLQSGNLSYDFVYAKGELTGVSKNSAVMEQHVHTDADPETNTEASTESFYPTQASPVYSTKAIFDKYGRLTAIDGVLTNVYDASPAFNSSTGALIPTVNNGSAYLAMTTDEVRGETARFSYNTEGTLVKKTVTKEADFSNKISQETFAYDNLGRLASFVCTYNWAAGQGVTGNIKYAMDASVPNADSRVEKYTYTGTGAGMTTTENTYDDFKRITKKTYSIGTADFTKNISYNATRVDYETDNTGKKTYYKYYDDGKIKYIGTSQLTSSPVYEYDQYGQLVRENNKSLDKTFRYNYDESGNLVGVDTFAYTTGVLVTPVSSITLGYTADRLTSFDGTAIAYNSLGRPTTYEGKTLTWSKGKLSRMSKGTLAAGIQNYAYTYNGFGQRIARSYGKLTNNSSNLQAGELTNSSKQYFYDHSGRLIAETGTKTYNGESAQNEQIVYLYDESSIIGMAYTLNGTTNRYYFQRNLLGDVVAIYDATDTNATSGTLVVKYLYDAWGNCTISGETTNNALAHANPIRYRGYYYDDDTGLYYLNARYYSPKWRRFISPDDTAYLDPDNVNGLNLYCYCNNDPVNRYDPSGYAWDTILDIFSVGWSLYDLIKNPSWENAGWLALDIVCAFVPFLTGNSLLKGASKLDEVAYIGQGINRFDNVYDTVVLGNNMDRVASMALDIGATYYGGYRPLNALNALGRIDEATDAMRYAAKLDNVRFIIDKFNDGYKFVHVGSDGRGFFKMMKSAYGMELKILYRLKYGNRLHALWRLFNSGRRLIW